MRFDLVVKGGTLLTSEGARKGDIGVRGGKIAEIGPSLSGRKVLEAGGTYVIPGGVDVHTHLDMPLGGVTVTADDFATGSLAAACGGTTTIIDYAAQTKGRSMREALDVWRRKADGRSIVDYGFHMSLPEVTEKGLEEMDRLVREGVTTFKLFMAYPGRFMLGDGDIYRVMERSRGNGGMVLLHAENGPVIDVLTREALRRGHRSPRFHPQVRPVAAEAEAVSRALALADMAGARVYIVHLSTAKALAHVREARRAERPVFAETCPQYLYLSDKEYLRPGFEAAKYVMAPPLRPRGNEEALWEGLRSGWLQVVATDHCSFDYRGTRKRPGKELGRGDFTKIPGGVPGIETRMLLLWDAVQRGLLSQARFVEVACTAPAKLFGLYPRKGALERGSDADIVLIDPFRRHMISAKTHHMNVDYNPYEGLCTRGSVKHVLIRGRDVVRDYEPVPRPPKGVFLKRRPV